MKTQKISPIAQYLTANKARVIPDGDIKRFVSPEGMYLGYMKKMKENSANAYLTEIFCGFKRMFTQVLAIEKKCICLYDKNHPVGITIIPAFTQIYKYSMDFINNTYEAIQINKSLKNDLTIIAEDEETNAALYYTEHPYIFEKKV